MPSAGLDWGVVRPCEYPTEECLFVEASPPWLASAPGFCSGVRLRPRRSALEGGGGASEFDWGPDEKLVLLKGGLVLSGACGRRLLLRRINFLDSLRGRLVVELALALALDPLGFGPEESAVDLVTCEPACEKDRTRVSSGIDKLEPGNDDTLGKAFGTS